MDPWRPVPPDDDAPYGTPSADHDEIVSKLSDLIILRDALRFPTQGKKFTLKSGRQTSYYLDVGALCAGHDGFEIGKAIAVTMKHHFGEEVDVVFAPGHSAIPLAVIAAQYFALLTAHATEWGYLLPATDTLALRPRLCGAQLREGRQVVIVDDVLTGGTALREAISMVKASGANPIGAVVLVDRCERIKGNRYVDREITKETGVKIFSCAKIDEIAAKISDKLLTDEQRDILSKNS